MANREMYLEAGRRLYAAMVSFRLRVSLAHAYRRYTPETVPDAWIELAERINREMQAQLGAALSGALTPKPDYYCVVCHEVPVDVEAGFDTCDACIKRV